MNMLRVARAVPSDVGHGRVRISEDHATGLSPGDVVAIHGSDRTTAAIYWRSRPEDAGLDVLRADAIIRENAGISIDEHVTVEKIEPNGCEKLVLSPVTPNGQFIGFGPGVEAFIGRGLKRRPLHVDERLYVAGLTIFNETVPFTVVQTIPEGIVCVTEDTEIVLENEAFDQHDLNQDSRMHISDADPTPESANKDGDESIG